MDNDHLHHSQKGSFHKENILVEEHKEKNSFLTPLVETAKATGEILNELLHTTQNTIIPISYRRNYGGRPKIDFHLNFSIDAWSILLGGYGATALGFYLDDYYEGLDFNYTPAAIAAATEPTDDDDFVTAIIKSVCPTKICFYCSQSLIFCGRIATNFISGGLIYYGFGEFINLVLQRKWGPVTSSFAGALTGAYLSRGEELGKMFRITTGFAFYTSVMEFIFSLFVFSFSKIFD